MFVSHTHHVGVGITGKDMGIVVGTKTCIHTHTHVDHYVLLTLTTSLVYL